MSSSDKKKAKPKAKKAAVRKAPGPKVSKTKKPVKVAVEEEKPKKATPRPKKEAEKKEGPAKVVVKAEPVRLGPAPGAIVASRHIDSLQERAARGFSFGELSSAGVPLNVAKREGLSLDVRRRSVVAGNVEALKGWLKSPAPAGKKK
jgi:ribosomal protein L13E